MAQTPKTRPTGEAVSDFLHAVEPVRRREDGLRLLEIMTEETGEEATMWGPGIVGFGTYTQTYADGRQADWLAVGFSPRKARMSVYILSGFKGYEALLDKLGKHKTGKSCLYINTLDDVDEGVLRELIRQSAAHVQQHGRS
jgi:hypothetical protein